MERGTVNGESGGAKREGRREESLRTPGSTIGRSKGKAWSLGAILIFGLVTVLCSILLMFLKIYPITLSNGMDNKF